MAGPAAFAGRDQTAPSGITADLDQVLIRILAVDGFDGPAGAALGDGPLHYLDPVTVKLGYDLFQRPAGDEAEIPRPHLRPIARLLPKQLQIDLLVAKTQRPLDVAHHPHRIEQFNAIDDFNREALCIERFNRTMCWAITCLSHSMKHTRAQQAGYVFITMSGQKIWHWAAVHP